MNQRNAVMRGKRSVLCSLLLSVVLLGSGCAMSGLLLSTLSSVGLSVASALLGSLVTSIIPTDNTTAG